MEGAEQNPTEEATPYKLKKAREKGSVARGGDLAFLTSLATFILYIILRGPSLAGALERSASSALGMMGSDGTGLRSLLSVVSLVMAGPLVTMAWLMAVVFLVVLLGELAQTGLVFTFATLSLDFSRLNPANGFKRVFSAALLTQTAKNLLKFVVYTLCVAFTLAEMLSQGPLSIVDAASLAHVMGMVAFRLMFSFAAAAIFFAALDQVIARGGFRKRMRMSRREVRRELREREGEPRIKRRRRELHREFSKLSQSFRNIRSADVLVGNPTHYAVALRYDPGTMVAPLVVSQAANQYAVRLRRLAFSYGVVIVHDAQLARALYHKAALNKPIPDALFRSVADIYITLAARKRAKAQDHV